jgi:hypothetical protein
MSAPPQAIAPNPHTNFLNVYTQIANEMGFQKKKKKKAGVSQVVRAEMLQVGQVSPIR